MNPLISNRRIVSKRLRFIGCVLTFLASTPLYGENAPTVLAIQASAPNFALPGVDGKVHKLNDFRSSKVLVVVFLCNHCTASQLYESRVEKIADDYRGKGVALVAILIQW